MSIHDLNDYNREQDKWNEEKWKMDEARNKYITELHRKKKANERFRLELILVLVAILIAFGVTWMYESLWEGEGGFNLKTFIPFLPLSILGVFRFHNEIVR